jgi:hypothetical protein
MERASARTTHRLVARYSDPLARITKRVQGPFDPLLSSIGAGFFNLALLAYPVPSSRPVPCSACHDASTLGSLRVVWRP